MKRINRTIPLIIILVFLLNCFSIKTSALAYTPETRSLALTNISMHPDGRVYQYVKGIPTKNLSSYKRLSASIGERELNISAPIINGVVYLPFRQAASMISSSHYHYDPLTKSSTMTSPGLKIVATDGCYVTYANDRALFNTTPCVIMNDGRMYMPAAIFAKAIGMTLSVGDSRVELSGSYSPLIHADRYYRADEVFWLARIIHAESRGEPLLGQIAVGNVVMNRVRSKYYPNTIYSVIFDRKYGVQFSPVLDGTIYNTPNYSATLAAKICLEGYDVTGGAFFFLEPNLATSSWIPATREYAFTIANHDFYY